MGSHTFSHYYCLEPGQNEATFRADLSAAQAMRSAARPGADQSGTAPQPVEPRLRTGRPRPGVQLHPRPPAVMGPPSAPARPHQPSAPGGQTGRHATSASRLLPTTAWNDVLLPSGLCDVPASAFLRPYDPARKRLEPLRLARLRSGLRHAAQHGRIFHLWWHPHNFSQHQSENFAVLEQILDEFDRLAAAEGMQSLTMADVAATVSSTAPNRARDP